MLKTIACLALSLLVSDLPAAAQERTPEPRRGSVLSASELPEDVIKAATDFYNDPRRRHFRGPAELPGGDTTRADVAALEGPLIIRGRVEGSVVMVNGDVRLYPGSAITGDLLLVGGELSGVGEGTIGGEILVYRDPLRYREEGDRIVRSPASPVVPPASGAAGATS